MNWLEQVWLQRSHSLHSELHTCQEFTRSDCCSLSKSTRSKLLQFHNFTVYRVLELGDTALLFAAKLFCWLRAEVRCARVSTRSLSPAPDLWSPSPLSPLQTRNCVTNNKIIAFLQTTSGAHTNWIRFYHLDFKFCLKLIIKSTHKSQSEKRKISSSFLSVFSFVQCSLAPVTILRIKKEKNRKYFLRVEDVTSWVQKFPQKLSSQNQALLIHLYITTIQTWHLR